MRQDIDHNEIFSVASLVFSSDARPGQKIMREFAARDRTFAVSLELDGASDHSDGGHGIWMELVANGLTFDVSGLKPGEGAALPEIRHRFGLPADFRPVGLEAVRLVPGPHLAGGHRLLPVLRTHALLAARLALLPNVQAIAWHPAGSWNAPEYFRTHVMRWIEGGAFPGLGLAALVPTFDGGIASEGLELFTGQEIELSPDLADDRPTGARTALRLMHWLVENGTLGQAEILTGPSGEQLLLEPSANGRLIKVCKT